MTEQTKHQIAARIENLTDDIDKIIHALEEMTPNERTRFVAYAQKFMADLEMLENILSATND